MLKRFLPAIPLSKGICFCRLQLGHFKISLISFQAASLDIVFNPGSPHNVDVGLA